MGAHAPGPPPPTAATDWAGPPEIVRRDRREPRPHERALGVRVTSVTMNVGRALALALVLASATPGEVHGQPGGSGQAGAAGGRSDPTSPPRRGEQPAQPRAHDAGSVAGAPTPDQAHGVARAEPDGAGNSLRILPRLLLLPPRVVLWVVDAPLRGTFWLYERYQLRSRFKAIFFNDTGTVGLFPVAFFETGFGLNAGLRFIHRDLGRDVSFKGRASFGGPYRQLYSVKLGSGDLVGDRVKLELEAEHEIRPKDRFFGIGNADELEEVPVPIDPYLDPAAVDTRFRETLSRVSLGGDVHIAGPLSARLSSALLWRTFDQSDRGDLRRATPLDEAYDPATLPGFEEGVSYSYNELELRLDTRGAANRYEMPTIPSNGVLVSGFGGVARAFGSRLPIDFVRYGADVQAFVRLAESPRLFALRAYVEGVTGDLDEIPFVDLPRLGGPILLRGYPHDRFRDRVLGLTSIEYQFDVGHLLTGFLFADAGRVYHGLRDIAVRDIRVGYGGGLQMQSPRSFLGRFSIASSIDGGLTFLLGFDPVYDPKARVERR